MMISCHAVIAFAAALLFSSAFADSGKARQPSLNVSEPPSIFDGVAKAAGKFRD